MARVVGEDEAELAVAYFEARVQGDVALLWRGSGGGWRAALARPREGRHVVVQQYGIDVGVRGILVARLPRGSTHRRDC